MITTYSKPHKQYLCLVLAIIITRVVSLSMHALIMQNFQAPVLKPSTWAGPIGVGLGTVIAAVLFYIFSETYWLRFNRTRRVILLAVLLLALTGNLLRLPLMNIIGVSYYLGSAWALSYLVLAIPPYLQFLILSWFVCFFVPKISEKKQYTMLFYFLLWSLLTFIFVGVGVVLGIATQSLAGYLQPPVTPDIPTDIAHLKYGPAILIPAYISYLEPTIAAFITYFLIQERLAKFRTITKGLILAGIIDLAKIGIYPFLEIAYSTGDLWYRLFYYSQFPLEYLALGLLTAYSFKLLKLRAHAR